MSGNINVMLLKHIAIFSGLDHGQLTDLSKGMSLRHCRKKEVVVSRRDNDRGVYFIAAGSVRVTSFSANGKEASFRDKDAGDLFGELSAIDANPRTADVVALTDATLLFMEHRDFNQLLQSNPSVNQWLIEYLVNEVRSLTQRVYEFSALNVRYRIYAEIYRLAQRAASGSDSVVLSEFPTHADLASRVSTTREAVTREISRLSGLGLIVKRDEGIELLSLTKLKEMQPDD